MGTETFERKALLADSSITDRSAPIGLRLVRTLGLLLVLAAVISASNAHAEPYPPDLQYGSGPDGAFAAGDAPLALSGPRNLAQARYTKCRKLRDGKAGLRNIFGDQMKGNNSKGNLEALSQKALNQRVSSCPSDTVIMQGIETRPSKVGDLVYLWANKSSYHGSKWYGQSGLVKSNELTSQSTSGRPDCGLVAPDRTKPNDKKKFCNGGYANGIMKQDKSRWSVLIQPRHLPDRTTTAMHHLNASGTYVWNKFNVFGIQSEVSGLRNKPLVWSLIDRSGGGIARGHMVPDTRFFLTNVQPRKFPSYSNTCKTKHNANRNPNGRKIMKCRKSDVRENGNVWFYYGYVESEGKRVYGWALLYHQYRKDGGDPKAHFEGPLPKQLAPSKIKARIAGDIDTEPGSDPENLDDMDYWPESEDDEEEVADPVEPEFITVHPGQIWKTFGAGSTKQFMADVDGDDRDDAIAFHGSTRPSQSYWDVALSTGAGFGPTTRWLTGMGTSEGSVLVGDVTGDGKADAVTEHHGLVQVAASSGSNFVDRGAWLARFAKGSTKQFLGDVNGDGTEDFVAFFADMGSWVVAESHGTGFTNKGLWTSDHGRTSSNQMLGDVDGDRKADAVVFFHGSGDWYTAKSTGVDFLPWKQWAHGWGNGANGSSLADVNGDGVSDALAQSTPDGAWYFAESDGQKFGVNGEMAMWFAPFETPLIGDVDGNHQADLVPFNAVSGTWTVAKAIDTRAPETEFESGPGSYGASSVIPMNAATFGFSSPTDIYVSFECQLDTGNFSACSSPRTVSNLSNGKHKFSVRARDAAGNLDPEPVSLDFTVDWTAPDTSISTAQNPAVLSGLDDLTTSGDVNADGFDDLAGFSDGVWTVALALPSGGGFEAPTQWASEFAGDSSGSFLADVNLDHQADAVQAYADGKWRVALSNGTGFSSQVEWTSGFTPGSSEPMTADVNADGRSDAIVFEPETANWKVAISTGSSFADPTTWLTAGSGSTSTLAGDVTGDGRADLVYGTSDGRWYVAVTSAQGDSAAPFYFWRSDFANGARGAALGDVNGDGTSDLVAYFAQSGSWYAAPSTGTTFLRPPAGDPLWASQFGLGARIKVLGDFNNDGKSDAAAQFEGTGGEIQIAKSTGSSFDTNSAVKYAAKRSFNVSTLDDTAHLQCRLDNEPWADCTSLYTTPDLSAGTHTVETRAIDAVGNIDATPAKRSFRVNGKININFQPADAPVPAGYLPETGQPLAGDRGNGYSYGFYNPNGTSFYPTDKNAANSPDQRYDTFVDISGVNNNDLTPSWAIEVPYGTYRVHLVAGDANSTTEAHHKLDVEGVNIIDGVQTTNDRWFEGTKTVDVTDGYLQITQAAGGFNNKLSFVEITPVADTAAPIVNITSPVSSANVKSSNAKVTFNSNETATFECKLDAGTFAACASNKVFSGLANGSHTVSVKATDTAGNSSTTTSTFTTGPQPIKINFQPAASAVPPGYLVEHGLSSVIDRGNGYTYGFSNPEGTVLESFDRDSASSPDQRYDTNVDMAGLSAYELSSSWMIELPYGTYQVHLVAGDPTSPTAAHHKFDVEGINFIDGVQTATNRWFENTKTIDVTDGYLQITQAAGSYNNKLAFIEITPVADTAAPIVNITSPITGTSVKSSTAKLGFTANENASFECKLDAGAFTACESNKVYPGLTNGSHTLAVKATDSSGNTSTSSSTFTTGSQQININFQPADAPVPAGYLPETAQSFADRGNGYSYGFYNPEGTALWPIDKNAANSPDQRYDTYVDISGDTAYELTSSWAIAVPYGTYRVRLVAGDPNSTAEAHHKLDVEGVNIIDGVQTATNRWFEGTKTVDVTDGLLQITQAAGGFNNKLDFVEITPVADTAAPIVKITSPLSGTSIDGTTAKLKFSTNEQSTAECKLDAGSFVPCSTDKVYNGLSNEQHTITVRATDSAGNASTTATVFNTYSADLELSTADRTAPQTTLTAGISDEESTTSQSLTFEFTSSKTPQEFSCVIDGVARNCTSPFVWNDIDDGKHSISVAAIDQFGNHDPSPVQRSFYVDAVEPVVTITGPALQTNDTTPTITFSVADATATTTQCYTDLSLAWFPCSSGDSLPEMTEGQHWIVVAAYGLRKNVGAYTGVLIDTAPPETTVTSGPLNGSTVTSLKTSFGFASNDAVASFECQFDSGTFASCASPFTSPTLLPGAHTFTVRSVDKAGNFDPTPVTVAFTASPTIRINFQPSTAAVPAGYKVDSGLPFADRGNGYSYGLFNPATEIPVIDRESSNAPDQRYDTLVDISGNGNELTPSWGIAVPNGTYEVHLVAGDAETTYESHHKLDVEGVNVIDGIQNATSPRWFEGTKSVDVADGYLNVTQAAGGFNNKLAYIEITPVVDTVAPVVTIKSPASGQVFPDGDVPLDFSVSESAKLECQLDAEESTECVSGGSHRNLPFGQHTFTVKATDAAENVSTVTVPFSSGTPPIHVNFQPAGAPVPAGYVAETGEPFGDRGNGLFYGLGKPAGVVTDAVDRNYNSSPDQRYDTFIDMGGASGVDRTPYWKIALPNGTYQVHVVAGDAASSEPAFYRIGAEGLGYDEPLSIIDAVPTDDEHWFEGTRTIDVYDGFLTVTQVWGSLNNKINFIDITSVEDSVAPQLKIHSPYVEESLSGSSVDLRFQSNEPATFTCQLDGGATAPCASGDVLSQLSNGQHSLFVWATDTAGNVAASSTSFSVGAPAVDTTPPDTAFLEAPADGAQLMAASAGFAFSSEPAATFECNLDATGWAACTSPRTLTGLSEGTHRIHVRARDIAGNVDPTPVTRSFEIDNTSPQTTIASAAPDSAFVSGPVTYGFASDSAASFECSIDAAEFNACAETYVTPALAEGSHDFAVRARDGAGNVDATPATATFTVDTSAPETSITSGPAAGATISTPSATFAFESADATSTFECKIDAGSYESCASSFSTPELPNGSHTFSVRSKDSASNVDPTPESRTFTVAAGSGSISPITSIISGPAANAKVSTSTVTFGLSSPDPSATFECRLDSGAYATCASPFTTSTLTEGSHEFFVRAKNASGDVDSTPATRAFTVDTVVPDTSIVSGPSAGSTITTSSATLGFASTDSSATFECRADDGPYQPCETPKATGALTDRAHTFYVRARDAAGNVDATPASRSFTVDTTPPDTTITSGLSAGAVTSSSNVTFGFTSLDSTATFECKLGVGTYETCASPFALPALPMGDFTFIVRARDAAGNIDPTPAIRTFTIASSPVRINFGGSYAGYLTDNGSTYGVKGSYSYGWNVPVTPMLRTGPGDDRYKSLVAVNGNTSAEWKIALANGQYMVRAVAGDGQLPNRFVGWFANGNVMVDGMTTGADRWLDRTMRVTVSNGFLTLNSNSSPENVLNFIEISPYVPNTGPSTSITLGPQNGSTVVLPTQTFGFSSPNSGVTFECKFDTGSYAPCVSLVTSPTLADGMHTFDVRAKFASGVVDPSPEHRTFTVDTTAPDTSITSGPANGSLITSSTAVFGFSSSEAGSTFECKLDSGSYAACVSPFSASALADGTHTFSVRAKDATWNTDASPATRSFTVDTTAPETTIASWSPSNSTVSSTMTYTFSGEQGAEFQCRIDGGAFNSCTSPFTTPTLAAGAHDFAVRAVDAAGNIDPSPATRSFTVDTTAPETTITSGPANASTQGAATATYGFSSNESGAFECKVDTGSYADCTSPFTTPTLSVGTHTFYVRARDAAFNYDPTPASRTVTVTDSIPVVTILTPTPNQAIASTTVGTTFTATNSPTSYTCKLDANGASPCTSPAGAAGISQGAHTLLISATNASGTGTATVNFTVDTVLPDTTITSGPANASSQSATTATYGFSSNETATFECKVDSGSYAACTSPFTTPTLSVGAHTFYVRAKDAAGNYDSSPASRTVTVTSGPAIPVVTISAPTANQALASTSVSVAFTATNSPTSYTCKLDAAAASSCTSPSSYTSLSAGSHSVTVSATNAAGTGTAVVSFTVDTTAPDTTITSGPANATSQAAATATYGFSSTESGTFECKIDSGAYAVCTSPFTTPTLSAATHTFYVRAKDAAGNYDATPASRTLTVTSSIPVVTILTPTPNQAIASTTVTTTFTATNSPTSYTCKLDANGTSPCTSPAGATGISQGAHTLLITATNASGTGSATVNFTVDTVLPDTTITSGPANAASQTATTATYGFSSNETATFECKVDSGSYAACTSPFTTPTLSVGAHTFYVRAKDAAGNYDSSPASRTLTVTGGG